MYIFILLITIYLILGIISINYPKLLLPISICLLPLERFNIYMGFSLSPLILYIPIILLSIFTNFKEIKKQIKLYPINKTIIYSLLLILLAIIVTDVFAINRFLSLKSSIYVFITVFMFIFGYLYISIYKNIKTIINSIIVSDLIVSIYGIIQFISYLFFKKDRIGLYKILHSSTINPSYFLITIHHISILRPDSTFTDVNTAAGYILLSLPMILTLYILNKRKKYNEYINRYLINLSPIIAIYFILTFSKSAFIGLFIIILYLIYIYKIYKNTLFKYFFTLTVILVLAISYKINLIKYVYTKEKYSYLGHFILTKYSYYIFEKHPITGTGIGSFTYYFGTYIKPYIQYYYNNIDNPPVILLWLSEIGLIGFIAYLNFFINYFRDIVGSNHRKSTLRKYLEKAFIAGIIGILIANLFHSYLTLIFNWELMGVFLGIIYII